MPVDIHAKIASFMQKLIVEDPINDKEFFQ